MDDLKTRLQDALRAAMVSKDNVRRDTIRQLMSAIKQVEVDERKTLTDDDILTVLQREIKQRRESLDEARKAGRGEATNELEAIVAVLEGFLPAQLSRDELVALVREAIAQSGATSAKEMGKVMGVLMPKVKGKADGKLVNEVVREQLS
jgi:uncharacterized protein YqeY